MRVTASRRVDHWEGGISHFQFNSLRPVPCEPRALVTAGVVLLQKLKVLACVRRGRGCVGRKRQERIRVDGSLVAVGVARLDGRAAPGITPEQPKLDLLLKSIRRHLCEEADRVIPQRRLALGQRHTKEVPIQHGPRLEERALLLAASDAALAALR